MKTLAREHDCADIARRLQSLRPDSVARWGRMSAHQAVCHLGDGFLMALGQKRVTPAGGLLERTLLKWIALYVPLGWPAGVRTSPEIDQLAGAGTRPVEFTSDLARLELLLDHFSTTGPERLDWPSHPIFGRMSGAAWLRWGYLHMNHHLRQFGV